METYLCQYTTLCAWCGDDLLAPIPDSVGGDSHGMCPTCLQQARHYYHLERSLKRCPVSPAPAEMVDGE